MCYMKGVLPIIADIANGVFATLLAGGIVGVDLSCWHFLLGILMAMLPDLDAVPELFIRGNVAATSEYVHDHRDFLHYPILFILFGVLSIYFLPFWGWVFLIATTLHFINDFYGTGWGVALFWPITNRRYKLLGRRANLLKYILLENGMWNRLTNDERKLRFVVSWSHSELSDYIRRYGEKNWIEKYYLTLNWISAIEYLVFGISVLVFVHVCL